jgi:hypothetical protein
LTSFLEVLAEGPVDPLTAFVFFETALAFADLDAGVALEVFAEVLAAGLTDFAVAFALASGLATAFAGLEVFATGLAVLRFPATFLGTLLEPAVRASFFGAAGAFANWSSRRKFFPGITKTHVKSDKSV